MGETGIHVLALIGLLSALRVLLRHREDMYVIGNVFLYYQEGNPKARKAPDVMVIRGVSHREERRTFKTWEEKAVPSVIFEISSRSTWIEDTVSKAALYSRLGVKEYFIFDPMVEYLDEQFVGFRLEDNEFAPIERDEAGGLYSQELGTRLVVDGFHLRVIDPESGAPIPSLDEAVERTHEAEEQARQAEEQARQAELRAAELAAENARLRSLLDQLQSEK